jgi:hypothetical protein
VQTSVLINAVVQRTMVFIAQLATAGGVRAPLANLANQVFLDLSQELQNQGVSKKVIADMFGLGLRTYHRKVRELSDSRSEVGRTLWEAILSYVRSSEPVSSVAVHQRFSRDDPELVSGVLNDLVNSQLVYRAGRGASAVYRVAQEADFALSDRQRQEANLYLVWLTAYRQGPLTLEALAEASQLSVATCERALEALQSDGRVQVSPAEGQPSLYSAREFAVAMGTSQGWEAAVLDHYQAMLSAIGAKLSGGAGHVGPSDTLGGSTWSFNVWRGHPFEAEAKGTLARVRAELSALRQRVDEFNRGASCPTECERVVVYLGQYVREVEAAEQNNVELA